MSDDNINTQLLDNRIQLHIEKSLKNGGGSGDNGGMVDNRIGRIEEDMRTLWKVFIGGFMFLIAAFGSSWYATDARIDSIDGNIIRINGGLDKLEDGLEQAQGDIIQIKSDVKELQGGIQMIQSDISIIKAVVTSKGDTPK